MAIGVRHGRYKAAIIVLSIINMLTGLAVGGIALMVYAIDEYVPEELLRNVPEIRLTVVGLIGMSVLLVVTSISNWISAIYRRKFAIPLAVALLVSSITAETIVVGLVINLKVKGDRYISQSKECQNCADTSNSGFKFVDPAIGILICVISSQAVSLFFTRKLARKMHRKRRAAEVAKRLADLEHVFEDELEKHNTRMSEWIRTSIINSAISESTNLIFGDSARSLMDAVKSSRESLQSETRRPRATSLPRDLDRCECPHQSLSASQPVMAVSGTPRCPASVYRDSFMTPGQRRFSTNTGSLGHSRCWMSSPAMTSVWSTPEQPAFSPPVKERFILSGNARVGTEATYWRYMPAPLPVQVPDLSNSVYL